MNMDLANGRRDKDPMRDYHHNKVIKKLFSDAKKAAFVKIQNDPEVRRLREEKIKRDMDSRKSLYETTNRNIKEKQIRNLLQN